MKLMFSIKGNKTYEADYISKPYSFYLHNDFLKFIFLSNFYKIFLTTIITMNNGISCVDFYQILILICPDFPKLLVKKINIIYFYIKNKERSHEKFQQYEEMENEISCLEFYILFCVFYFYNGKNNKNKLIDFFKEIERFFNFNYDNLNPANVSIQKVKDFIISIDENNNKIRYTNL